MNTNELFYRFGIALGIGFLIGLQREFASPDPERKLAAGIRTFSLLGVAGCAAAFITSKLESGIIFTSVVLVIGSMVAVSYYFSSSKKYIGMTTEISAIITMLIGAICYLGEISVAVAVGVVTTLLLSLKLEIRAFVRSIQRSDVIAALKFAVITAIVLPVLPNQSYGPPPLDVLNPYSIWLMVVFISGIGFLGYVLIKVLGSNLGIGLTGLLGGMVSSMAVTLGFAQRSKEECELTSSFALAIIISWTTMFFRVAVITAAINISLLKLLWLPLLVMAAVGAIAAFFLYHKQKNQSLKNVNFSNPFDLTPAIKFGLFFALILVVSKAAQTYLGETGVYISSLSAGLADLNAITLSLAGLSRSVGSPDSLLPEVAARGIVLASVANTLVKGVISMTSGTKELRRAILPGTLAMVISGILASLLLI